MGFLKEKIQKLFGKTKPPEPTVEEKRAAEDAAKLAEYRAFDDEVGAIPTQETLQNRFRKAAYAGHTSVVKDTIDKGLHMPNEISDTWWPPFGGNPITFKHKPLELAASRNWDEMVAVMIGVCDRENLEAALRASEANANIAITKSIRAEMAKRDGEAATAEAAGTTTAAVLIEPIAVRKTTIQLKN